MDKFTDDLLKVMLVGGGNKRARTFFVQHGWSSTEKGLIDEKYRSRAAQLYRALLQREAKGMKSGGDTPRAESAKAAEEEFDPHFDDIKTELSKTSTTSIKQDKSGTIWTVPTPLIFF